MAAIASFSSSQLEAIAKVLEEPTGSQITGLLAQAKIDDPGEGLTKWRRLHEAFAVRQRRDGCANAVCAYIQTSLDPVRYVGRHDDFDLMRERMNQILSFAGLSLGEDGKLRIVDMARTLDEAENRAIKLRRHLVDRGVHPDVLKFCRAELLQENYFHAVFEATKSVADKLRSLTRLTADGAGLVDQALSFDADRLPLLAVNSLRSEAEQSEQRGMMNLLKGMFGTFRNTTAHAPKIHWIVTEQDALDLFSLCSLLHRRIDAAVRTPTGIGT
jgi:uncharacterized protein (TIGR02391 family)